MEECSSTLTRCSDDEALRSLLEAFGSLFSIEEIASAYQKAGENADDAGLILYDKIQEKTSTPLSHALNGKLKQEGSSGPSYEKVPCNTYRDGKSEGQKQNWSVVSAGTDSSVLGKDYVKPMTVANGSCVVSKPFKLDEQEFAMPKLQRDERNQATVKNDYMHKDMGDFLFKLLGNGFKLERDVIHQVLEICGYDMQKSMEKLLDLSEDTLEKGKEGAKHTEEIAAASETSCQKNLQQADCLAGTNGYELSKQVEDRNDLQKEVLVSLFNGSEKYKLSRKTAKSNRRSIAWGELVVEPLKDDDPLEIEADSVGVQLDNLIDEDEGGEDRYQQLREAVKEHRTTMKEYYKAAVTAFAQGDGDRANKLMDQGHFFCERAREADEESSQEIFKTKNTQSQEDLVLDLHAYGGKEAIRLLKCHLSSFAGIPSLKYLKVILEKNGGDLTKGSCRRFVMKLLEKESIKWTEGGDTGIIQIHLETVKRKPMSITKP